MVVPDKIIEVATSKQSVSVVGECIVGDEGQEAQKTSYAPSVGFGKSKESRRLRFQDDGFKLGQTNLGRDGGGSLDKVQSQKRNQGPLQGRS